jgi:hypothetical protein
LFDPTAQGCDLLVCQRRCVFGRGHRTFFGTLIDGALFQISGNDGVAGGAARQRGFASGKIEAAARFLRVMTANTALVENRHSFGSDSVWLTSAQQQERQEGKHCWLISYAGKRPVRGRRPSTTHVLRDADVRGKLHSASSRGRHAGMHPVDKLTVAAVDCIGDSLVRISYRLNFLV